MKTLTLVQLAQAIERGKYFQVYGAGSWHNGKHLEDLSIAEIRPMLEAGLIRIKPEPREYWIVGQHAFIACDAARGYCTEYDIDKSMITHVKEVIE